MEKFLVEVTIHRIQTEGDDQFEVLLGYGEANTGKTYGVEELSKELASYACYFVRKAYGIPKGVVYYDFYEHEYTTLMSRIKDNHKMFYKACCANRDDLSSFLYSIASARDNLDLVGKVIVRWKGCMEYVKPLLKSGDAIAIF